MPKINVRFDSEDRRAKELSNLSCSLFMLDDKILTSVEGFVQGIKYPCGHPTREIAFHSAGVFANKLGEHAERKLVWWNGMSIPYGSNAHHKLIERAIRAKFEQNGEAMDALIATEGMQIVHELETPEAPHTSLPSVVFCDILTRVREEALKTSSWPA